jgi:hypothetical protein
VELQKAVQKAAKFTDTDNLEVPGLSCLRFIAATPEAPPRVAATTGRAGIIIEVDAQIPDAVVFVKDAVPAFKQVVVKYEIEGALMRVWSGPERVFDVPLWDPAAFPPFPDMPQSVQWAVDWERVLQVVHAVGGKKARPLYQYIHFREDKVEATDVSRIAVVDAETGLKGLLPGEMFQKWPAETRTALGQIDGVLWALVGDEARWGKFLDAQFAEVDPYIPEWHSDGPIFVGVTDELREVVRQAVSVSIRKTIEVKGSMEGIRVSAYTQESEDGSPTRGYEAMIKGDISLPGGHKMTYPKLMVDGSYLLAVLKVVKTPCVRLCYSTPMHPLRLESGALVEVIWPKVE